MGLIFIVDQKMQEIEKIFDNVFFVHVEIIRTVNFVGTGAIYL